MLQPCLLAVVALAAASCRAPADDTAGYRFDPRPSVPYPAAPNVEWASVRFGPAGVELVRSQPKRGAVTTVDLAEWAPLVREGRAMLVAYQVLDAAGTVLVTDWLAFLLEGETAYVDPARPDRVAHATVSIEEGSSGVAWPYFPEASVVEFAVVVPDEREDPKTWKRAVATRYELSREGRNDDDR